MPLLPCSACHRHVRVDEVKCPFCATLVAADAAARAVPSTRRRLDRMATFTFATTLTIAACGGSTTSEDGPGLTDSGSSGDAAVRSDGGPIDDGSVSALYGASADASDFDVGNVEPPYGLPPVDASPNDASDAGVQPLYGLPPVDAGDQ